MGFTNIFLSLTCFIINGLLSYTYCTNNDTKNDLFNKTFVSFMNVLQIFCVVDIFNSLSLVFPDFPSFLSFLSLTLFYLALMFLCIFWIKCIFVYFEVSTKKSRKIILFLYILLIIETIVLCINFKTHFIFNISAQGNFENGEYGFITFAPFFIIDLSIFTFVVIKILKERNKIIRKRYFGFFFFTLIPFIYSVLQIFFGDISLDVIGFTLAVLIIYIYSVSKKKEDEVIIQKNLQKDTIVKSVNVLYDFASTDVALDKILNLLNSYHNSEHVSICEFDYANNVAIFTHIKNKRDFVTKIENNSSFSLNYFESWLPAFEKTDTLFIDNIEKIEDKSTNLYNLLLENNFSSIMAVPIRYNEKIVGFILVANSNQNINDFTVMHAVSSIIYSEITRRKHNKQDDELIKILASEYSSVLYTNINDGKIIPYSISEEANKTYGALIEKGITLERILKIYIEHEVYPADMDKMKKYSNLQFLKNELRNKKKISVIFRTSKNGSLVYHEVSFVKIDDENEEPTAIAIGFINKMEEIISQYVMSELLESYSAVFYIDFPANKIKAYKQPETMDIGNFAEEMPYDTVVHKFADLVDAKYKPIWDKLAVVHEAQKLLMEDNNREIIYEVSGLERKTRRAYWKVLERQDGIPVTAIVSFMGVDNATARELEKNTQNNEQKQSFEKEDFLSNISHDIRTSMNSIIGFTELALQNIDDKDKIKDYILKSNVSGQHLLSLLNDIDNLEDVQINEEDFKGKRILVVEDNEMNREIAEEILKENNFIVETAEDGKYAVEMVMKSEPGYYDVILMDIRMPLMDGYTATREIRKLKNKALAEIPIIAMTASSFAEDKEEAKKAGMNEYVSKPISIDSLLNVISRYL